jgi:hypothetical protein
MGEIVVNYVMKGHNARVRGAWKGKRKRVMHDAHLGGNLASSTPRQDHRMRNESEACLR